MKFNYIEEYFLEEEFVRSKELKNLSTLSCSIVPRLDSRFVSISR